MSKEKDAIGGVYKSFEQLFNDAANNMAAIKGSIKPNTKHIELVIFNLEFNTWLGDNCGWNGQRDTYDRFLTKDFFIRFMQYKNDREKESIAAAEQERQSWEVNKSEFTTQQELTKKDKSKLTHRQRAIILYFKEKAEIIPYQTRQDLREQENGSMKLYNTLLDVRKGRYSIDDLETAIEFLAEFPTAHALAIDACKKS